MARGDVTHVKVHYKGADEDFLVMVDSVDDYNKWLGDKSVPLAQVVSSFKVFTTHKYVPFSFLSSFFSGRVSFLPWGVVVVVVVGCCETGKR
jgi:hypothetical protein